MSIELEKIEKPLLGLSPRPRVAVRLGARRIFFEA